MSGRAERLPAATRQHRVTRQAIVRLESIARVECCSCPLTARVCAGCRCCADLKAGRAMQAAAAQWRARSSSCCLVRAQASGCSRECNVCGIHLQCTRLVECGCRLAGVEWRCAAAGALGRCCGERQSRACSVAKQCNILYIETIEDNHSNVIASSLVGCATVNAWSIERIIWCRRTKRASHRR